MTGPRSGRRWGVLLGAILAGIASLGSSPSPADAAFDRVDVLSETGWRNYMVTTPDGEVVIAWQEEVEDPSEVFGIRRELWVAVEPPDGPLGEPQLIDPDIADCSIQLEVDEQGNVALGYSRWTGSEVYTALKRPGEPFDEPLAVPEPSNSGGAGYKLDIADGDVAVGWTHYEIAHNMLTTLYRATISRDGALYGPNTTLHKTGPYDYPDSGGFDVSLAPSGELTMIWTRQDEYGRPWLVQTAHLSPAGVASAVQTLAESENEKSCPQVDGDATGRVAALWMESSCDVDSLHLAKRWPGEDFRTPTTIASAGWIRGPDLDVASDGTISVGYSDGSGVKLLVGSFETPIIRLVGPSLGFRDLAAHSEASRVIASSKGDALTVGDIGADGRYQPGPWIDTSAYYATTGPIGNDRAALLFQAYGEGLRLATGSLEPLPPSDGPPPPDGGSPPPTEGANSSQQPPTGEGSSAPPLAAPWGGDGARTDPTLQLWDDGLPGQALGRRLTREAGCNIACLMRGRGQIRVPVGRGHRRFRLGRARAAVKAGEAVDLRLKVPAAARRRAARALARDRQVFARVAIRARSADGSQRLTRTSTIQLAPRGSG